MTTAAGNLFRPCLACRSGPGETRLPEGEYPLGRREPTDFEHVEKYPYSAVAPRAVAHVERVLRLPWWHWGHDQGKEGSCVGHGISMERAITNIAQAKALGLLHPGRRYNPLDVWNEAKKIDEWPDTNPGDDHGTSVRAGYDVCRDKGLVRVISMRMGPDGVPVPYRPRSRSKEEGVQRNRWAGSTDEVRTAVASGLPVAIGVNWYSNFDRPVAKPSPDGGLRPLDRRGGSREEFVADTPSASTERATRVRHSS